MTAFESKAAVIGAGASGITAAKTLMDHGIAVDVFEKSDHVGGNWAYDDRTGHASVYKSTYINTSKQLMAYSDYDMSEDTPDYPHHSHITKYFNDYVDHFHVRERIQFETAVEKVEPAPDGRWEVTVRKNGENRSRTERYGAVFVCNGHHWDPSWPDIPGDFSGKLIHSHDYKDPKGYEDKRVLILGLGNSGVDIAVELSRIAPKTCVSIRRGYHILPKYVANTPLDHFAYNPDGRWIPRFIGNVLSRKIIELLMGDITRFGIPEPHHDMQAAHPTISQEFLPRVGHGDVQIRPNIKRFDGKFVEFVDGRREVFDVVITATGYKITFPFLSDDVLKSEGNKIDLYKWVVHPDRPNLFFIGFVQPWGAIMPISEMQSKWTAKLLTGELALPSKEKMRADILRLRKEMEKRYLPSARHTIQVDQDVYMLDLWREMTPPGPLYRLRRKLRRVDPFTRIVWKRVEKAKTRGYSTTAAQLDNVSHA